MTSSIFPPRSALAPCSPSTQAMASTTLLLPDPLGPTTALMPGSKRSVVAEAKDLKPRSVSVFRCTGGSALLGRGREPAGTAGVPATLTQQKGRFRDATRRLRAAQEPRTAAAVL